MADDDNNKYHRAGQRRTYFEEVEGEDADADEADWDFATEAWGQKQTVVEDRVVDHPAGLRALFASGADRGDLWYGEATVRFVSPRISQDDMLALQRHFPASFRAEGEAAWILAFTGFSVDTDTRHRVVTVFVASTGPLAHLKDLPAPSPLFVDRHYIIKPTNFVVGKENHE